MEAPGTPTQSCQTDPGQLWGFFSNDLRVLSVHPRALSELARAAVANGCWQWGHLFNPSAKSFSGGLIMLVCICLLSHLLAGWN